MNLSDIIAAYESSKKLGYEKDYDNFVKDLINQPEVLPIYDFMENFFGRNYREGGIVSLLGRIA